MCVSYLIIYFILHVQPDNTQKSDRNMSGNAKSIRSRTENSEAQARAEVPKINKKRNPIIEPSVDDSTDNTNTSKRKPSRPRS